VDLGPEPVSLCAVTIDWEAAYGSAYELQTSDDLITWTTVYSGGASGSGEITHMLPAGVTARYLRYHGTARGTRWGHSFWTLSVRPSSSASVSATTIPLSTSAMSEMSNFGGAAALIAALLLSIPLVGTMVVAARYGVRKVPLWLKLHVSHTNPNFAWFYLSLEDQSALRQKLCASEKGSPATELDEFGPSPWRAELAPKPPAGTTPPPPIVAAQRWLAKEEDAVVSRSVVARFEEVGPHLLRPQLAPTSPAGITPPPPIVASQRWLAKEEEAVF